MRKTIIIIMAMVVALGALPVTFACYHGGWGHWDRFWRPGTIVVCSYNNECNVIFDYDSLSYYDNESTFPEPKDVGDTTADITNGGKNLEVTVDTAYPGYEGTIDFCIKNVGIYPATVNGINIVKDSPFYAQLDFTGITELTVIQPGDTLCGQLVIHSIPQSEEAQGKTFTFDITIDFVCFPTKCETAYAYYPGYATCFLDLGFTKWGWINGPLGTGHYELDIYAGAGQCDLSKGELIGTLFVDYYGSTATVLFDIMDSDYTMTETHLYVGNDPLPPSGDPGMPGQYPYKHTLDNETTDTYVITNLTGYIYIIAHAVACPQ